MLHAGGGSKGRLSSHSFSSRASDKIYVKSRQQVRFLCLFELEFNPGPAGSALQVAAFANSVDPDQLASKRSQLI